MMQTKSPVNVFYIARKLKGANEARRLVESLLTSCRVCCPSRHEMQLALALPLKDFEDAVQIVSASSERLDAVVTRDPNDYMAVNSPIFSPVDFLVQFNVV
jgi:predicted nucleic acid-binding protein